jgi:hypothetical protein
LITEKALFVALNCRCASFISLTPLAVFDLFDLFDLFDPLISMRQAPRWARFRTWQSQPRHPAGGSVSRKDAVTDMGVAAMMVR